jgi:hypothetical protein
VEDGTADLIITHCILRDCFGDGVRLLGKAEAAGGQNVKRLRIENCLFQTNKRSGLGIQRALEQIIIANCFFDATVSDQSIDFEPTGSDAPTDLVIQGCIINHTNRTPAVSLSGISGPDPLVRCKFTNNIILGGEIFCTDVDQLTIQNNVVLVTNLGSVQRIPVQVQRGGDSVVITGNLLVNDDTVTSAVIALSEVNQRQVTRALIANNLCFARFRGGIVCRSCDDVTIQGNMLVAMGACTQGIFVDSEASNVDNISVRDNDIMTEGGGIWRTGIQINAKAPHQIHDLSVVGNSVRGASEGIRFNGLSFQRTPVCALNRIDAGVASPLVGIGNLPEDSLVVGGATSRGGTTEASGTGRLIVGVGKPNNKVTGNVGDIFQRIDVPPPDEEDPSNLYLKTSGNGTNTGWMAK